MHMITHDDGIAILGGYFSTSPINLGPADDNIALDTPSSKDGNVSQIALLLQLRSVTPPA
jgi:hypothetical protein